MTFTQQKNHAYSDKYDPRKKGGVKLSIFFFKNGHLQRTFKMSHKSNPERWLYNSDRGMKKYLLDSKNVV